MSKELQDVFVFHRALPKHLHQMYMVYFETCSQGFYDHTSLGVQYMGHDFISVQVWIRVNLSQDACMSSMSAIYTTSALYT